jgi:hypothetical protein
MNNLIDDMFGIVMYDVIYGDGAIILNDNSSTSQCINNDNTINNILDHNDLFAKFDDSKIGLKDSIWEIHGYALVKNNHLIFKSKSNRQYDEDLNDGWKIKYFKNNIYNQYGTRYTIYDTHNYQVNHIDKYNSFITLDNTSKL